MATDGEERIAEILGAWLEAQDRGEERAPEEVIREHPDLADELRARFAAMGALVLALAEEAIERVGAARRFGDFEIEGKWPINPSGGVQSTNPIGATALIRVAEAGLQVRGDAGEHQVPKDVKTAMASGFGGTYWTVLMLLTKEL